MLNTSQHFGCTWQTDLDTCWLDMCLVMELLGPDLRSWQLCFGNPGLVRPVVKQILTQVKKCKDVRNDVSLKYVE